MKGAIPRLHDALEAARELTTYVEGRSYEQYLAERMRQRAVERVLEIIGEAFNQAIREDPSLPEFFPDAYIIVGMRNRIIHGYDELVEEVIWSTAVEDVPALVERLEAFIRNADGDASALGSED
jgi:uncharacterized protein with HEPN domain